MTNLARVMRCPAARRLLLSRLTSRYQAGVVEIPVDGERVAIHVTPAAKQRTEGGFRLVRVQP